MQNSLAWPARPEDSLQCLPFLAPWDYCMYVNTIILHFVFHNFQNQFSQPICLFFLLVPQYYPYYLYIDVLSVYCFDENNDYFIYFLLLFKFPFFHFKFLIFFFHYSEIKVYDNVMLKVMHHTLALLHDLHLILIFLYLNNQQKYLNMIII